MTASPIIFPPSKALDEMQQHCVDVLTDALEMAVAGRISSVAMVVCMDDGIAPVMAGKNGGALNVGLDQLKHQIRTAMFEDGNMGRSKSKIMRAK